MPQVALPWAAGRLRAGGLLKDRRTFWKTGPTFHTFGKAQIDKSFATDFTAWKLRQSLLRSSTNLPLSQTSGISFAFPRLLWAVHQAGDVERVTADRPSASQSERGLLCPGSWDPSGRIRSRPTAESLMGKGRYVLSAALQPPGLCTPVRLPRRARARFSGV